jgi:hypothetical protein
MISAPSSFVVLGNLIFIFYVFRLDIISTRLLMLSFRLDMIIYMRALGSRVTVLVRE